MTPLVLPIAALAIAHGVAEREGAQPHRPRFPIRQVIFVVKENRTFDNYFGKFPGADGATSGRISDGTVIPLGPLPNGPQGEVIPGTRRCSPTTTARWTASISSRDRWAAR